MRSLLTPLFRQAQWACRNATAITGITEEFVDWGIGRGGRSRGPWDRAFPMGYKVADLHDGDLASAAQYWRAHGVGTDGRFTVCFFGNLGRMFDLATAIKAARVLEQRSVPVRFVLCGSGERLAEYKAMATGLDNVLLPGWIDAARIHVLLRLADAGIDPLPDRYDYLASVNNKAIEYLSAGVPVISSPARGVLADTLAAHGCGISCEANNADALADAIQEASADGSAWDIKRQNAATLFKMSFDAGPVYTNYSSMLESLVEQQTSRIA
jgi:glycosyltransferase involved in cell wall biosynthesis